MPQLPSAMPMVQQSAPQAVPMQMPPGAPLAAPTMQAPAAAAAAPVKRPRQYDPDNAERGNMLGFNTVATSLGIVLGLRFGGIYGGVAGSLFAGSASNGYRAILHAMRKTPEGNREALISGTWSVVAAGLAGFIVYKTKDWRKKGKVGEDVEEETGRSVLTNRPRSRRIRAII